MRDSTQKYMEEWMGEGKCFWFHFPDGIQKTPTEMVKGQEHLLARDSEEGRDFRARLVSGEITEAECTTIPTTFWKLLP